MKVRAYIGLGANLGEGRRNLLAAWKRLGRVAGVTTARLSRPYRSAPLGVVSEHWFTNAVGEIETELEAGQLLGVLLEIERQMGRDRRRQGSDRPIDLDLLLYGAEIISRPRLEVPHPQMSKRLFVLEPLKELAPGLVHPGRRLTIAELAARLALEDPGQRIIPESW